jgi:GR25 family glycosyltransferase involved in LPS biosynthesis
MKEQTRFFLLGLICIGIVYVWTQSKKRTVETLVSGRYKIFYINLDTSEDRRAEMEARIKRSDLKDTNIQRYPGVVGKDVELTKWVSPSGINSLKQTYQRGYRTYHHELTLGAVGCYISHLSLMTDLLSDPDTDFYIIMEDDCDFTSNVFERVQSLIASAPDDWDMLLCKHSRLISDVDLGEWKKARAFWGMMFYVINKKGAQKIINETNNDKTDSQIDSYLSRMAIQNKLKIYASEKNNIVYIHYNNVSTVQMPVKPQPGINPFLYGEYDLR